MTWDPATYLKFDIERARPFYDLLARVDAVRPRRVVDLGCGPGHLTGLLAQRWPGAEIDAVDSSEDMVADAVKRGVPARLLDVRDWHPGTTDDVIVCNAVLQWVPEHRELLARWLGELPVGAWFALQVPDSDTMPVHVLTREVLAEPRWRDRLAGHYELASLRLEDYAELLEPVSAELDAWETTYLHRLTGDDPVFTWMSGSGLRPIRDELDDQDWDRFRADLGGRLRQAYPVRSDGTTWFPFNRRFLVARAIG